jgi:hypothetical protein
MKNIFTPSVGRLLFIYHLFGYNNLPKLAHITFFIILLFANSFTTHVVTPI